MFASQSSISSTARRAAAITTLVVAGALVASACGSSSSPSTTAGAAATTMPAASGQPPGTTATPQSSPVTIAAGSSSRGPIVVDAAGHALYRFDKDLPRSGTSACNGACASAWPPVFVTGQPTAGAGLTGTLSVVTRANGTQQVALDGHPLYRFSGDQGPGDTTGDGFGGIWHVVHTTASSAASSSSQAGPSGY